MSELRAYDIADELRAEFGIEVSTLGCVMLNVSPLDTTFLPRELEYVSQHPDRRWIHGLTPEGETHVTLLYGLLRNANEIKPLVDRVLEGWTPESVQIKDFKLFDSPFPDEPYQCLVADVLSPNLMEAHQRLSLIPHINTFMKYAAHVTIGYVQEDKAQETQQRCIDHFSSHAVEILKPTGIDYGYVDQPSAWERPSVTYGESTLDKAASAIDDLLGSTGPQVGWSSREVINALLNAGLLIRERP